MKRAGEAGYTLVELLVAAAVLLLLTALTCLVLIEAKTMMEVSGERADVQQRARAGMEGILSAIRDAGAGSDRGARAGPLIRWMPPVWPGRNDRAVSTTGLTIVRVLHGVAPAALALDAPAGTATLDFDRGGCPLPCGFADGMNVIVLDGRGDFPAINDIVRLSFEYLGDPFPPLHPRPPEGEENCLYDSFGTPRIGMPVLPPAGATLAPLDVSLFEDGPWCGSGAEPFDADLLRIRSVRVSLRAQASNAAYRGPAPGLFQNPGTAAEAARQVKDVVLQTTVTPRNLGGWR